MRVRKQYRGLTVNAIAGTYVVFFGLDVTAAKRPGLRGFAFMRLDHVTGESVWLRGMKTFASTAPHPAAGSTFSTLTQPVQSFQWADYATVPGRAYTYTIVALQGDPAKMTRRIETTIDITTEVEVGGTHSAFFNRGSVATQEYARRFQNKPPDVVGPAAYAWLSRGLFEALLAFIGRATKGWAIHAAVYEFQWPAALDALKKAAARGAQVHVLFDDIRKGTANPSKANRAAIKAAGIGKLCKGRTNGKIMHNKFFVLSKVDAKTKALSPVAVWTGSTNLTENGIHGHANVGHIINDAAIATHYFATWQRLSADPKVDAAYRSAGTTASPSPPVPWSALTAPVFSPRGIKAAPFDGLDWFAAVAGSAKGALMMTFAFGMDERFNTVYGADDDVLRMALLDKGGTTAQAKKNLSQIRARANVVVAIGNNIVTNAFDRWLAEMARIVKSTAVPWVHTKFMLVDALGPEPIVVSGSANFSKPSCQTNDENMVVIRGDLRVADIYFGEYLRLYNHYAFRESVKRYMAAHKTTDVNTWTPQFLIEDDSWLKDYFNPKDSSARYLRRAYFAGPMAV